MALTNSLFRSFFEHKDWRVPRAGEVFGVGIRGVRLLDADSIALVENRAGYNNDALGWCGPVWFLAPGTVEPGNVPPHHPRGMAHRADGEALFQHGDHKGHPAFIQYGPAKLWRDRDGDHHQDPGEPTHTETGNGLNWHAGSKTEVVGPNSEGCLNTRGGWNGAAWRETYRLGKWALDKKVTYRWGVVSVFIMSGKELVEFSNG